MTMTTFTSEYAGLLIFPNGKEVSKGDTIELSDDEIQNAGVADWIETKAIVKGGAAEKQPADTDAAEKAKLTSELEALGGKADGRWSIDRLREEVAKAMEAATKPTV
jgi:hypothetical protein